MREVTPWHSLWLYREYRVDFLGDFVDNKRSLVFDRILGVFVEIEDICSLERTYLDKNPPILRDNNSSLNVYLRDELMAKILLINSPMKIEKTLLFLRPNKKIITLYDFEKAND